MNHGQALQALQSIIDLDLGITAKAEGGEDAIPRMGLPHPILDSVQGCIKHWTPEFTLRQISSHTAQIARVTEHRDL
jgi:hypothetical protein